MGWGNELAINFRQLWTSTSVRIVTRPNLMKADNNMVLVSGLDEHKSDLVLDAASFGV